MAKSRNFSVYLLKEGFDAWNSLKEDHNLALIEEAETNIPPGGNDVLWAKSNKSSMVERVLGNKHRVTTDFCMCDSFFTC